jgi:hypothetical protein
VMDLWLTKRCDMKIGRIDQAARLTKYNSIIRLPCNSLTSLLPLVQEVTLKSYEMCIF